MSTQQTTTRRDPRDLAKSTARLICMLSDGFTSACTVGVSIHQITFRHAGDSHRPPHGDVFLDISTAPQVEGFCNDKSSMSKGVVECDFISMVSDLEKIYTTRQTNDFERLTFERSTAQKSGQFGKVRVRSDARVSQNYLGFALGTYLESTAETFESMTAATTAEGIRKAICSACVGQGITGPTGEKRPVRIALSYDSLYKATGARFPSYK